MAEGMELLGDLASNKARRRAWNWDGTVYPKTKRAEGPDQWALTMHAEVLGHLLTLAPNGYPCPWRLRDLFCHLHLKWGIFDDDRQCVEAKSPFDRAALASNRWRIMCKHCVMLNIQNDKFCNIVLANVVDLVQPTFVLRPVPTAFDDTSLKLCAMIKRPVVPYLPNGLSDWGQVEDLLPFGNMEVAKMKLVQPECRKRKPDFHHSDNTDCTITAHVREPAHKKNRRNPAETAIPAATAVIDEPTNVNIAANQSPEKPFAVPENFTDKLDKVADFASVEAKRQRRRLTRERKKLARAAPTASKQIEGKPGKVKNGELTSHEPTEPQNKETNTEEQAIGPPYSLKPRLTPFSNSCRQLLGTVAGQERRVITSITACMHVEFSILMEQIYMEAMAGVLKTKEQAIRRRDALIDQAARRAP